MNAEVFQSNRLYYDVIVVLRFETPVAFDSLRDHWFCSIMQVWFLCFVVLSAESALCSTFCLVSVQLSEITPFVGNMCIQPDGHFCEISDLDVQPLIVHQLPFAKDDNTEKKVPSACIYMHVKRQI